MYARQVLDYYKKTAAVLAIFSILLISFPLQLLSLTVPQVQAAELKTILEPVLGSKSKEKEIEIAADRLIIKLKSGVILENQPDNKVKTRREGLSIFNTGPALDKTLNKIGASNARRTISNLKEGYSSISILGFKIPTGGKISSDFGRYFTLNFDPKLAGLTPNFKTVDKNIETFKVAGQSQEFQKYQMLIRMIKANPEVEDVQLSYRYKKIEDIATDPSIGVGSTGSASPTPTATPTPTASLGSSISVVTPNGGNSLKTGESYRITWHSSNVDRVSIGYSPFGSCLDCIAKNIPNTGYYDWKVDVGATINTKFKILLIGYKADDSLTIDQSDDYFTISANSSAQLNDSGGPTPSPSVSPSLIVKTISSTYPNDPYFSSSNSWGQGYDDEWNIKKIQADQAWSALENSPATITAVLDSGIDYNHEDLKDVIWTDENGKHGFDFVNNDDNPIDDDGHGTHVAGIIGASINNGKGVVGVSSKVQIMAVKGLDQFGSGFDDQLASGIIWATDHEAKVINISWGGYGDSPIINQALEYANSHNVTLAAAAGNDNTDVKYFFPANQKNVMAVAASDENDQKTVSSNWGAKIDLTAPGGGNASECQGYLCYTFPKLVFGFRQ